VFRGSFYLTLDNKGRLVIPARYRDVLLERCGGHLVITVHPHGCLLVYPLPEWEAIEQKLEPLATLEEDCSDMVRLVSGKAHDTQMDAAGRLLIAPHLRTEARLEKNVVLAGMGRKFELWDQPTLEARLEASRKKPPSEFAQQLKGFAF
jgi:MraZ protein